jgi:hypothetical protein
MTSEQQRVVIDGGLVRLERTVLERTVKTADFLKELARRRPFDSGPLPIGCVWLIQHTEDETKRIFILQKPAGLTPITFRPDKDLPETRKLTLSWPTTLWFVETVQDSIKDVYLTAAEGDIQIRGRQTKLYKLLMPNQYDYGGGAICTGDLILPEGLTLPQRVAGIAALILESSWNQDLMPEFTDSGIESLDDWAQRSTGDPDFHKQIRFPEHTYPTVGRMLDNLTGG